MKDAGDVRGGGDGGAARALGSLRLVRQRGGGAGVDRNDGGVERENKQEVVLGVTCIMRANEKEGGGQQGLHRVHGAKVV